MGCLREPREEREKYRGTLKGIRGEEGGRRTEHIAAEGGYEGRLLVGEKSAVLFESFNIKYVELHVET